MSASDLEQATKGGQYALHSQTVQALCQKFAANLATTSEMRRQELSGFGCIQTEYPHHSKPFQTVVWKDQALLFHKPGQNRAQEWARAAAALSSPCRTSMQEPTCAARS